MTTRKQQQAASKQSQPSQKNNGSELACSETVTAESFKVEPIAEQSAIKDDVIKDIEAIAEQVDNGEGVQGGTVAELDNSADTLLMIKTLFSMAAMIGGEHWQLEPSEAELLAQPLDEVLDKYFPNMGRNLGCEFSLALAAFMVVQPRIQITRELKAEAEEAEQVEQTIEAEKVHNPKDEFSGVPH